MPVFYIAHVFYKLNAHVINCTCALLIECRFNKLHVRFNKTGTSCMLYRQIFDENFDKQSIALVSYEKNTDWVDMLRIHSVEEQ